MKWVMVNKYDEVINKVDLKTDNRDEAIEYFSEIKQMDVPSFKKFWRVLTESELDSFGRKPSSEGEFGDWLDIEKS